MTCGYICPKCNGSGFDSENLSICDWCNTELNPEITYDDWINTVHNQNCCSDIDIANYEK